MDKKAIVSSFDALMETVTHIEARYGEYETEDISVHDVLQDDTGEMIMIDLTTENYVSASADAGRPSLIPHRIQRTRCASLPPQVAGAQCKAW